VVNSARKESSYLVHSDQHSEAGMSKQFHSSRALHLHADTETGRKVKIHRMNASYRRSFVSVELRVMPERYKIKFKS